MAKHTITTSGNTMKINLEGQFSDAEAKTFADDYQKSVSKIDSSKFELTFDVTRLAVLATDKQDYLKGMFQLYKSSGFKKIVMIMGENVVLAMQTKRIAKEVGFANFEIK